MKTYCHQHWADTSTGAELASFFHAFPSSTLVLYGTFASDLPIADACSLFLSKPGGGYAHPLKGVGSYDSNIYLLQKFSIQHTADAVCLELSRSQKIYPLYSCEIQKNTHPQQTHHCTPPPQSTGPCRHGMQAHPAAAVQSVYPWSSILQLRQ